MGPAGYCRRVAAQRSNSSEEAHWWCGARAGGGGVEGVEVGRENAGSLERHFVFLFWNLYAKVIDGVVWRQVLIIGGRCVFSLLKFWLYIGGDGSEIETRETDTNARDPFNLPRLWRSYRFRDLR